MTLAGLAWAAVNLPGTVRFARALDDPETAQRALLARYLRRNAETAFGRAHGFAGIRSIEAYQERVPLASWDDLCPWIDRVAAGEPGVLTAEPVLCLEPTGGSTAAAKLVPYTAGLQREIRRAVAPWIADLLRTRPGLALGAGYWSITPLARPEAEAAPGAPRVGFADDAEYLGGLASRLAEATLAVPAAVRHLTDPEAFRYATLLFLLRRADLALVSVWHPSFLTLLLDALPRHWEALLGDLDRGTLTPPAPAPEAVHRALAARLTPVPLRAAALRRAGPEDLRRIWPRLALVSCWGDGHAALALGELRRRLPGVEVQPKGLVATEAFVTLPFRGRRPLAVRSHFFEFLPEGAPAGERPRLVHQLEPDGRYEVVVTTGGGLYRYRLGDTVEVTEVDGFGERTPSLRFLGKVDQVADLCGEKLSEGFVAGALATAFERAGVAPRFALLAPEPAAQPPGYVLYVDAVDPANGLDRSVEAELSRNPCYRDAVALGQLAPVRVIRVAEGAAERYLERCRALGQRLGDVKPLALSRVSGWDAVL